MPKIIPDVRKHILESARRQLIESGFSGLSLRGVAADCGIALGTTYNYFSSKADLASAVMKEDWDRVINSIGENEADVKEAVCNIYRAIHAFTKDYGSLIREGNKASPEKARDEHTRLVEDLTLKLKEVLHKYGYDETDSYLSLAAELILAASTHEGVKDEDFADMTERLFDGTKVDYA